MRDMQVVNVQGLCIYEERITDGEQFCDSLGCLANECTYVSIHNYFVNKMMMFVTGFILDINMKLVFA